MRIPYIFMAFPDTEDALQRKQGIVTLLSDRKRQFAICCHPKGSEGFIQKSFSNGKACCGGTLGGGNDAYTPLPERQASANQPWFFPV